MYPAPELYAGVAIQVAATVVVGQGLLSACGWRSWSWLAPVVGLAAVVVVAAVTIPLPGRDATATAAIAVAVVAAAAAIRYRRPAAPTALRVALPVAIAILLVMSLPFAAGGGFGAFWGKSNDLGYYLYDAAWLQTHAGFEPPQIIQGFPMGPPAVAAVTSKVLGGTSLVAAFTALMVTTGIATALASLALFHELPPGRRGLAAFLVGLPYMTASFYLQSSFKEMAMGAFAFAFALLLRELARAPAPSARAARLVPIGVVVAASVYTYSFAGLYWPGGTLALWGVSAAVLHRHRLRGWIRSRPWTPGRWASELVRSRRRLVIAVIAAAAILAVAIPAWGQVTDFARSRGSLEALGGGAVIGDLPGRPWFYTALGVWPVTDYRATPPSTLVEVLLVAAAVAAFVRGALELGRRRELAVIAATGAGILLYLLARWASGPYVQSKALAIMAPVTMAVLLYGVLVPTARRDAAAPAVGQGAQQPAGAFGRATARWKPAAPIARAILGVVFVGAALFSTYLALAGALVNTGDQARQLEALGKRVQGASVLFLGADDYVGWELRGAAVYGVDFHDGVPLLPTKPHAPEPWPRRDWDSVNYRQLDLPDFVITMRTPYTSEAPANFKPVAATRSFVLWKRGGRTGPRRTLLEGDLPGGVPRCDTAAGRPLSRARGTARTWPQAPVYGPRSEWHGSSPPPAAAGFHGFHYPTALVEGRTASQTLRLGRGRWAIVLQYEGAQPVRVRGPGLDARLPPSFQRLGTPWPVGTVTLRRPGRVRFEVGLEPTSTLRDVLGGPDGLNSGRSVLLAGIGARRLGQPPATVPLRRACGRFVDWYRPS